MNNIIHYNICVKKVYQKDGQEKVFWPNVGSLTYFPPYQDPDKPAGFKLELPIFGDTQFFVFERKPKMVSIPAPNSTSAAPIEYPQTDNDLSLI
jgi:hypothetical protein